MVFLAAPVMRTVARMLLPSTRQATTCARRSVESLFILTIVSRAYDSKGQFGGTLAPMSTPPPTGTREFRDQIVQLASLTVNTNVLEGLTFQNCQIIGPTVLVPLGSTAIVHCTYDAPDIDAIFWEIPEGRTAVVGAIAALDCTFSTCRFFNVGLAGPRQLREMLEAAVR